MLYTDTRLRLSEGAGLWWRAEAYEVRGGYIRPAAGAALKPYDPWEEHERVGRGSMRPVYETLLALLRRLRIDWKTAPLVPALGGTGQVLMPLHPDDHPLLEEWCACHGLLGVLLHEARMVAFPPVFERSQWLEEAHLRAQQALPRVPPKLGRVARGRRRRDLLAPTQRYFVREAAGWRVEAVRGTAARIDSVLLAAPVPVLRPKCTW